MRISTEHFRARLETEGTKKIVLDNQDKKIKSKSLHLMMN